MALLVALLVAPNRLTLASVCTYQEKYRAAEPVLCREQMVSERFLTAVEISDQLQVLPMTVRDWLRNGKLVGVKLPGGDWRIRPEDLEEMLKRPRAGVA